MKTTWWLRIVGMFYLFLALGSVWVVFINPNIFGSIIPFAANGLSLHAFSDAWLIFTLELGVLGVIMLYYARVSEQNRILVLTISVLELIRGAGGDLLWMSRGWPAANYTLHGHKLRFLEELKAQGKQRIQVSFVSCHSLIQAL